MSILRLLARCFIQYCCYWSVIIACSACAKLITASRSIGSQPRATLPTSTWQVPESSTQLLARSLARAQTRAVFIQLVLSCHIFHLPNKSFHRAKEEKKKKRVSLPTTTKSIRGENLLFFKKLIYNRKAKAPTPAAAAPAKMTFLCAALSLVADELELSVAEPSPVASDVAVLVLVPEARAGAV